MEYQFWMRHKGNISSIPGLHCSRSTPEMTPWSSQHLSLGKYDYHWQIYPSGAFNITTLFILGFEQMGVQCQNVTGNTIAAIRAARLTAVAGITENGERVWSFSRRNIWRIELSLFTVLFWMTIINIFLHAGLRCKLVRSNTETSLELHVENMGIWQFWRKPCGSTRTL